MKKLIVGVLAVGAVIAVRPVVKRRMVQMREHCGQVAGKCKQMMAAQGAHEEPAAGEHRAQEAPQFVGHGEAVTV